MEPSPLDPTRLVHLNVHLTGVVVLAAYSAALISFLAIKTFVMPFTTMEGLLKDGTYRFAVVGDSADYSFFQVRDRNFYIHHPPSITTRPNYSIRTINTPRDIDSRRFPIRIVYNL